MAKKSFNPFKMWGSYVGALIPIVYLLNRATFRCTGNAFFGTSCTRDFSVFFNNLAGLFIADAQSGQTILITIIFWIGIC